MVLFEDIKAGARLCGLDPAGVAEVVQVTRFGPDALNLVFCVSGRVCERLVFRGEGAGFQFLEAGRTCALDADGGLLRLASEAYMLRPANLRDPHLAVSASQIEALADQITYEDAAGRIIQVLPNAFRSDARFEGGRDYRIPGDSDRFRLRVTQPFRQERFTVYASTTPIAPITETPQQRGAGLAVAQEPRPDVALRARGLEVAATPPMPSSPTRSVLAAPAPTPSSGSVEFYEAVWLVTTRSSARQPAATRASPPTASRP